MIPVYYIGGNNLLYGIEKLYFIEKSTVDQNYAYLYEKCENGSYYLINYVRIINFITLFEHRNKLIKEILE